MEKYMNHINVYDKNNFVEKIILSDDGKTFINLNSGIITYYDNENEEHYTCNTGAKWYQILEYLIINNFQLISSAQILNKVYPEDIYQSDKIVTNQIGEIKRKIFFKYTNIIIRQHSERGITGHHYSIELPRQNVNMVASQLWNTRPFYLDSELINALSPIETIDSRFLDSVDISTRQILQLESQALHNGKPISINTIKHNYAPQKMIVVNGIFILRDLYANKKHLSDFDDPFELINISEDSITFIFEGREQDTTCSMYLNGKKTFLPMRHLIPIIFQSDRVFHFQILGYIDRLTNFSYHLKPLSIIYI